MMNQIFDPAATADYRQLAHQFLAKSREYLGAGDLHQASEKGWGAAAWMAKAVATAQGWEYSRHDQFSVVLDNARRQTGDDRLRALKEHRQRAAWKLLQARIPADRRCDWTGPGLNRGTAGHS